MPGTGAKGSFQLALHHHTFSTGLTHEPVLKGHLKGFLNFLVVPALFHIEAMINIAYYFVK
jgi:hypothetical protein